MFTYLTFVVAMSAAATQCCSHATHDAYEAGEENAKVCRAKGGIAITTLVVDDGGHIFNTLSQCAFPCDQRIAVEKH